MENSSAFLELDNAGGHIIAPDWPALASLTKKLNLAAGKMRAPKKDGENTYANYKYTTYEEVAAVVRDALNEAGLAFMTTQGEPEFTKLEKGFHVVVRVEMAFMDTDTGAMKIVTSYGEASDTQDKALAKAVTSAVKSGLVRGFMLSTKDDDAEPETGAGEDKKKAGPKKAPSAPLPQSPAGAVPAKQAWMSAGSPTYDGWTQREGERKKFVAFREEHKLIDGECKGLAGIALGLETPIAQYKEFPGNRERLQAAILWALAQQKADPREQQENPQ